QYRARTSGRHGAGKAGDAAGSAAQPRCPCPTPTSTRTTVEPVVPGGDRPGAATRSLRPGPQQPARSQSLGAAAKGLSLTQYTDIAGLSANGRRLECES